ncbi:MAG: hypothetical protein ACXVQJ_09855, partial [Actinomycetota bacterium]
ETVLALAQGDRELARDRALSSVANEARTRSGWNVHLAQVWWAGRIFGADVVDGESRMESARSVLEAHHWRQALIEPELVLDLVGAAHG